MKEMERFQEREKRLESSEYCEEYGGYEGNGEIGVERLQEREKRLE